MLHNVLLPQTFLPLASIRIGRLVSSVDEPQSDYLDSAHQVDVIVKQHENFTGEASSATDKSFASALTGLVSASRSRQKHQFTRITTSMVKTYQMNNSGLWFRTLLQDAKTRTWIEQAYRRSNDVYLVVGYHTMLDAQVTDGGGASTETDGSIQAPVTAAMAASGVVIPFPSVIDPKISGQYTQSHGDQRQFVAPGEQICAVQYRKVGFKWYSSRDLDRAILGPNKWKVYWSSRGHDEGKDDVIHAELEDDLELEGQRENHEIQGEGIFVY